jgi:hypothetical protein
MLASVFSGLPMPEKTQHWNQPGRETQPLSPATSKWLKEATIIKNGNAVPKLHP